jgi:2-desacetyl-2-hydroxyethyl bacteriochlorophyllide A dehydrogenase
MMKTMKVARLHGIKDMRMEEMPIPTPGPNDVVCKVKRCGVCGTDYAIYSGETSFWQQGWIHVPMTLGHEWSGEVAEVGSMVKQFKVGDRVAGDTCVSCGECYNCLVGNYYRCKNNHSVGTVNAWDGGYAEYVLFPSRHLLHLPDNVSYDQGAMVEPAATALYAVKRAEVGIGDSVLVIGTGPIGLLAAKQAKISGAAKVIVAGRKEFKLTMAKKLGADVVVSTTKEKLANVVYREAGREGVDRVIEASGSIEMLKEGINLVRASGTISSVAFYEKNANDLNIDRLVLNNISFHGVGGSLWMNAPVLNLLASGQMDPTVMITERYPFSKAIEALNAMREKNENRIKIMLEME